MSEPLATYWDSCVFIDALRKTPGRWEHIRYLEDDAKSGGSYIYTSKLTIAEVVRCKDDETFTDAMLMPVVPSHVDYGIAHVRDIPDESEGAE